MYGLVSRPCTGIQVPQDWGRCTRHQHQHKSPFVPFANDSRRDADPQTEKINLSQSSSALPSRREALSTATLTAAAALPFPSYAAAAGAAASSPTQEIKMVMRVTSLRGSVPGSWVQEFSTALEGYGVVALTQKPQLADIWTDLRGSAAEEKNKKGKKGRMKKNKGDPKPTTVDAVTLGDAWLTAAISQNLIQPIPDAAQYRYWNLLSPRWQELVTRGPSGQMAASGQVWAVPYRWGCTTILYRKDTARRWGGDRNREITDWDDLLLPGLKGRIAFIDSPRELVGVALKTLGLSYNATAADILACGISKNDVVQRVKQLVDQVKVFGSVDHVRAMSAGEVDVLVGWSDDVVPLEQRSTNVALAVPLSGTALWADLWCVPSAAAGGAEDGEPSPLLPAWFELGLQRARERKSLRGGCSPLALPSADFDYFGKKCVPVRTKLQGRSSLRADVMPSDEVLSRSEFLVPLDRETAVFYRDVLIDAKNASGGNV